MAWVIFLSLSVFLMSTGDCRHLHKWFFNHFSPEYCLKLYFLLVFLPPPILFSIIKSTHIEKLKWKGEDKKVECICCLYSKLELVAFHSAMNYWIILYVSAYFAELLDSKWQKSWQVCYKVLWKIFFINLFCVWVGVETRGSLWALIFSFTM